MGSVSLLFGNELVELAQVVLQNAGYETLEMRLTIAPADDVEAGRPLLLAQSHFFVLAVGAGSTLEAVREIEPYAVEELVRRAEESDLGAKQWDLYVVLMSSQQVSDDRGASSELVAINYNTRLVRRIAHAGVSPTIESIEAVLRSFLPLPRSRQTDVLEDALTLLEGELQQEGVDETLAGRAIASFRSTGSLASV
jgi:hypothetical protein